MAARTQFVVPQFIDVESKIIGFITMRQFLIILAGVVLEFAIYRIFLSLIIQLALGVPVAALAVIFAFFKVNGQPFHFIVLNMLQTMRKPMVRVWDKTVSDGDLRAGLKKEDVTPPLPPVRKAPLERSRLNELTLVVNTGGVYVPEEDAR